MALTAGEQISGGKIVDIDQRQVVAVEGIGGGAVSVTGAAASSASAIAGGSTTGTAGASASLIASNGSRKGLQVVVDTAGGASPVYLLCGAGTASATNFHVALAAGGSWDGMAGPCLWTGAVQYFSAGTPKVGVLEL